MEKDNTFQALDTHDLSLKNLNEPNNRTATAYVDNDIESGNKGKDASGRETVDEDNVTNIDKNSDTEKGDDYNIKESFKSDDNQKTFEHFNVKPCSSQECNIETLRVKKRRPSAEEIARNWQDLGVKRCKNCKFTTDDTELFKHHCTTCLSVRSTGSITLSYKDSDFNCETCNEVWKIKAEFEEHIVCHLQDLPYICLTCQNKKFSSRQLIERHTKTVHPDGSARCGLKGMKNGRKYIEELMHSGKLSINGKLSIPKTPNNHAFQLISKELTANEKKEKISILDLTVNASTNMHPSNNIVNITNSTVPTTLSSEVYCFNPNSLSSTVVSGSTIHHRPVLLNMLNPIGTSSGVSSMTSGIVAPSVFLQVPTTSQSAIVNENDAEVIANRPMPPARTTITLQNLPPFPHQYTSKYTGKSTADEAKSKHLDTLFGKLNKTTHEVQQTFISQKIKNIANPFAGDSNRIQQDSSRKEAIPYHLKTITEYTCTQPTKTTTSIVSSVPQQNLLLVPVGQPVMQPQGQLLKNVFYHPCSSSGSMVPIQALPVNTGSNLRVCQVQSESIPRQIVKLNQIPQKEIMQASSPDVTIRSLDTSRNTIKDTNKANFCMSHSAISARPVLPLQAPTKDFILPTTLKKALTHVPETVDIQQDITTSDNIFTIPKKYLFKIKPGKGFVCEACKKCTKDEFIFRRHVWEHFHGNPVACKTCSLELIATKNVLECKLISNIVCNIIKRSSLETLDASAKNLKVTKVNEIDVIDITSDENEQNMNNIQREKFLTTDVIVLDDEDENGDGQGLQIRISNSFSLSSPQNLELTAKEDAQDINGDQSSNAHVSDQVGESDKLSGVTRNDFSEIDQPKQTGKDIGNCDSQCDQNYKDVHFGLNIYERHESSIDSKQSPVIAEDEDDGKLKNVHLLDHSWSEPGNDSEDIVSKVLETNLKLFDPSISRGKKDESLEDRIHLNKTPYLQQDAVSSKIHEEQDDNINLVNKTVFETEILSKQSHHAFYVCGYDNCTYTGLSSVKYREHLQSKQHEREYNYVCGHCGQKDYSEDAHVRHLFSHANAKKFLLFKCPIRLCKYKSNLLHMYSSHLRAHSNEELTIKCVYCHKIFPSIESLELHFKQNLLKFVVCPYCSFKFMNKHTVMLHLRYFHPDRMRMISVTSQVVCNEREINFYTPPKSKVIHQSYLAEKDIPETGDIDIPTLLNQIEGSTKEKAFIEQNIFGKESENGDDAISLPEEDQGDIQENRLTEVKGNQKEMSGKKVTKGKGKTEGFKGGPKSLECPLCSYLSYNQSLHAKHISLHDTSPEREKRFVCNLCPKGTDGLSHFITHVKNHVGKNMIKVFCCTSCTYCSNQKRHIMDHVKDAHIDETLYITKEEVVESNHFDCEYCAFKARTSEQISAHKSSVHHIDQNVTFSSDKKEVPKSNLPENESLLTDFDSRKDTRKKKCKYHCEYCSEFFKHKSNLKEHIMIDHRDIENKQFIFFKCKYCTCTSTMKEMIISHLEKDHPGLDLRILRKIEMIENDDYLPIKTDNGSLVEKEEKSPEEYNEDKKGHCAEELDNLDKIEIIVPDGNIFKKTFTCPVCSFTTNMRIKAIKHLKEHPDAKPVRPEKHSTKPTARKSSSSLLTRIDSSKKKNLQIQQLSKSSTPLKKPFTTVKESDIDKNVLSEEALVMQNSPSRHPYILGEQKLHTALSACFIPLEKDMKYQCRICKQKIFKRFVLHRHILDHLKIAFFKCRYCQEGSIERTLMVGHIQKEHSSEIIVYDTVEKSALEQQFKERIFNQDFTDIFDLPNTTEILQNKSAVLNNIEIVKKPVHEYQTVEDETNDEDQADSDKPVKQFAVEKIDINLKCLECRYVARTKHHLNLHLDSHNDPLKVFTCSICDYRGDKFSAIKHVYSVPHLTQAKVLENGKPLYDYLKKGTEHEQMKTNSKQSSPKSTTSDLAKKEDTFPTECKYITNSQGKQVKKESFTVTKSGVFEMKITYKCKECGEKRESKSGMYAHFKTKCNKPVMKCSLCSFQNTVKAAIHRHASKRHIGKKITVLDLPMSAKFKLIKIPVRQDKGILKHMIVTSSFDSMESLKLMSDAPENDKLDVKQIRCQLCKTYSCESAMKLQFHVNTAHHGAMLYCEECSYKTPLVRHMMNHCQNLHLQRVARYSREPKAVKSKVSNVKEKVQRQFSDGSEEVVIKCPKCDLKFGSLGSVHTHLYLHFNYRPYYCKYCNKNFSRLDHVKNHVRNKHDEKPMQFDTKTDEVLEVKVKKIYESVKRSTVKQRIMLGKNRPSKLDKMELVEEGIRRKHKLFYCDFCQYYSERRITVRNHVLTVHACISKKRPLENDSDTEMQVKKIVKKDLNCDIVHTEEKADEKQHEDEQQPLKYKVVKTPNGSKRFKCSGCDYMNSKKKNLKLHVIRNHGERTEAAFKCFHCSYRSSQSSKIYAHFKGCHPSMKRIKFIDRHGEVVTHDDSDVSSLGKFSSSFSSTRSYSEPIFCEESPIKQEKKQDLMIRYSCRYCNYSGKGFFHFRLHLMMHKEFTKVTTELDEESEMSCGFCTYLGKNTFDLSVHIASHMGELRYKCAYCDFTQFTIGKVSKHLKYKHPDRNEMIIDRKLKKANNSVMKLVNFNPKVKIDNINSVSKKMRYKRIMIETDESSNNLSSDNDNDDNESKAKNNMKELENSSNPNFIEKREGNNKEVKPHLNSKKLSNETINTEAYPLLSRKMQHNAQDECISEHDDLIETHFLKVGSQIFSPKDKCLEYDELNENKCTERNDVYTSKKHGISESGIAITNSSENLKSESELGCKNINKSAYEFISDKNETRDDHSTSVENMKKEKSSKDLNKAVDSTENNYDPTHDKKQTDGKIEQGNTKFVTQDDFNCDVKPATTVKSFDSFEQRYIKNEAKGDGTDEIRIEGINRNRNDDVYLHSESHLVNENFRESGKFVFQTEEDNVNKDDHVTSELKMADIKMKLDSMKVVGNKNVLEKVCHTDSPNASSEDHEISAEKIDDNIFHKYSNQCITSDENSENKLMSFKTKGSALEEKKIDILAAESNINLPAVRVEEIALGVSTHCEVQSKSFFIENKNKMFSDEEDLRKLDEVHNSNKNLSEKSVKENLCAHLSSCEDYKINTSENNENEGKQLSEVAENKVAPEELLMNNMEIDELISSIEETVNEGKAIQINIDKASNEVKNSEMEAD